MTSPTRPYIVLHKEVGQTPLAALSAWKDAHPEYANIPATYAGRLDPMAEGLLLVLLGDECKNQEAYRGLDKEYEIEVLLDLRTDTGDVLGLPSYTGTRSLPTENALRPILRTETGTKEVPYPSFSSKTVAGKPLFMYALEDTLDSIDTPTHRETIHRIQHLGTDVVEAKDLEARIMRILAKAPRSTEPSKVLGADFRQDIVRDQWTSLFESMEDRTFAVLTLRVVCGSGAYMRTLAERIGNALQSTGLALSIRRTKMGTYLPFPGIWTKTFS